MLETNPGCGGVTAVHLPARMRARNWLLLERLQRRPRYAQITRRSLLPPPDSASRLADACGLPVQVMEKLKSNRGRGWGMSTWVRNRAGLLGSLTSREAVASHSSVRAPPPTRA